MMTIQLSTHTYELPTRRARQIRRSSDALADEVLHRELQPVHPYVETQTSLRGECTTADQDRHLRNANLLR